MRICKILCIFFAGVLLSSQQTIFADELILENDAQLQKIISQTGFRLLNSSGYENRITFFYSTNTIPKIKINNRKKRVTITKGIILLLEDENETATALSMAAAQVIDNQSGFFRRFSVSFSPRKYEIKADKKAVDLMVNAGYNPIALINFINKTNKEQNWFEYNIFHHNGTERNTQIYQYIYEKYPLFIANNEYIENNSYQNFLYTTKSERKKARIIKEAKLKRNNHKK